MMDKPNKVFSGYANLVWKIVRAIYYRFRQSTESVAISLLTKMEKPKPAAYAQADVKLKELNNGHGNGKAEDYIPKCGWAATLDAHARNLGKDSDERE
jgi:hypothetical protein